MIAATPSSNEDKWICLPVLPMPLVPTTMMRMGRCFGCRPNLANDDFGDVEFIVSLCGAVLLRLFWIINANASSHRLDGCSGMQCIHKINRSCVECRKFARNLHFAVKHNSETEWGAKMRFEECAHDELRCYRFGCDGAATHWLVHVVSCRRLMMTHTHTDKIARAQHDDQLQSESSN